MSTNQTLLGYYSQSLCNDLSHKYGSQLETLFRLEKLQLIGAIALWAADCELIPDPTEWQSLGEHAAENGTVFEDFDAFDIVQTECNFTEPEAAMPLLKALVAQLDYRVWLKP